jgi:hypothetical protein
MSKEHPSKALYELMEAALKNMKHIVSTSKVPEMPLSHLVFDIVSVVFFVLLFSFGSQLSLSIVDEKLRLEQTKLSCLLSFAGVHEIRVG